MKKYLVIGNPIEHSLSPNLHNFWIKNYNLDAIYEKKKLNYSELKDLILKVKEKEISGVNVTVPFKTEVIKYLDILSLEAKSTNSVNTICLQNDKVIGHNTDIDGFRLSLGNSKFNFRDKKIFILGAGGVVPSIIFTLKKMNVSEIIISNRTKTKAENLKKLFNNIKVVEWGEVPIFDMIINATTLGLNKNDKINLNFSKNIHDKFFYDIIYNPKETNFLKIGKKVGNKVENGKMMFVFQAAAAFNIWHKIQPNIDNEVIKLLDV